MKQKTMAAVGGILAVVLFAGQPAFGATDSSNRSNEPSAPPSTAPLHAELPFHHKVSLESATTVRNGGGLAVLGYRFESDSIAGDYWNDSGVSAADFLAEIERQTGTAPEVVAAYVDGADYEESAPRSRTADALTLGEDLPYFDAPDAAPPAIEQERSSSSADAQGGAAVAKYVPSGDTWWPDDAQVEIRDMGANLAITTKYSWWSRGSTWAAPYIMPNHWGMEFQVDFYTTSRAIPGTISTVRPICGVSEDAYKDWAVASNRPFSWFAWVIAGTNVVAAPGQIGFYGDYNDLTDPCTVSSIAVGAAQPQAIPSTLGGTQDVMITMYPGKGMDAMSKVGSMVQPVNRYTCEGNPWMPLTDCMGVSSTPYPSNASGPATSRPVLNPDRSWMAPNLCWYSSNFGDDAPSWWPCDGPS